jgi:hypothetical protein
VTQPDRDTRIRVGWLHSLALLLSVGSAEMRPNQSETWFVILSVCINVCYKLSRGIVAPPWRNEMRSILRWGRWIYIMEDINPPWSKGLWPLWHRRLKLTGVRSPAPHPVSSSKWRQQQCRFSKKNYIMEDIMYILYLTRSLPTWIHVEKTIFCWTFGTCYANR